MEEREIQDSEGILWKCIQTFNGGSPLLAEEASELSNNAKGKVAVVCTPSGGYQTVRMELSIEWIKNITDEDLKKKSKAQRGNRDSNLIEIGFVVKVRLSTYIIKAAI